MNAGQILGREMIPDKPNSPCAACGHITLADTRGLTAPINVAGCRVAISDGHGGDVMVMLCLNASACCARYRRGLQPAGYAALLQRDN
jgi:hypothetical protein